MPLCASVRRTSPFLILKKGRKCPHHFVVKAWGLPRRGKPDGVVHSTYRVYLSSRDNKPAGNANILPTANSSRYPLKPPVKVAKLPFRKLAPASQGQATMKFMAVSLPRLDRPGIGKADSKLKKNLLKLHPTEYFGKMSDPKFGIRERAALQWLKGDLNVVWDTLSSALKELRIGTKNLSTANLYRMLFGLKAKDKWAVRDHLLTRFVRWAILEVKSAKRVLRALGLTRQEIFLGTPRIKQRDRRSLGALLVNDGKYTTGAEFRQTTSGTVSFTAHQL